MSDQRLQSRRSTLVPIVKDLTEHCGIRDEIPGGSHDCNHLDA